MRDWIKILYHLANKADGTAKRKTPLTHPRGNANAPAISTQHTGDQSEKLYSSTWAQEHLLCYC